uniref:Exodeoxyribonuclease 7 small subunit n=1 Tax=Candidatus Kentrum sp. MB TaxID=2138164 RepID=A0A450WZE2_9GAMM|nr:MAG: Exodeoxyribonuclease VII small subunit [Candidatus Kentron sp. MB]VFK28766.1 MAG: Exodeoxyribonuclease VII small subunit [Candidatus Kentron sp. MB]VFK74083.1 MAG: Exodeoxyribonuclease VII small subunit [Candidatus Kentron sp. MB]
MTVSRKKTSATRSKSENEPNFEQSLAELEQLVTRMEQDDLTLDEILQSFERGIELNRICQKALDNAEQRVRILKEKEGEFEIEPFEEHG